MNIILEQRADVIQNNNTAQERLKSILENLNKTAQRIRIIEPLYGDIDFSILAEYGFSVIKDITLTKGEITSITGLPKLLMSLICIDNLLIELIDLPRGLRTIDITHNYFTQIDISPLEQLESLVVTDNKITELENLPSTLAMIRCDSNQLTHLNLAGLTQLESLNVSNNPITVIENMPENIIDFKMENTPSIEFRNSPVIPIIGKSGEKEEEETSKRNYVESLNEYFRLKKNYEDKLHKMKKKIHEKMKSKRAAQQAVLSLKPQCIKCKRPVGTIFSKKENSKYIAICGDAQNPCGLDIQIFGGTINPITWMLYIVKEDIGLMKDAIIRQKLDTLFGFVSEDVSIARFKHKLNAYNENNKSFKELLDKQDEAYHNTHKKELIDKKSGEIYKLIEQIRDLLEEYTKTENTEILKTAMQMQIKELFPETRNLRMLKNEIMEMHYDTKNDVYSLFQYPVTLSKIDDVVGEPPRVIKFEK